MNKINRIKKSKESPQSLINPIDPANLVNLVNPVQILNLKEKRFFSNAKSGINATHQTLCLRVSEADFEINPKERIPN